MPRLQGKVAIVTGAGQGIGAAIARTFAHEGARVVIAERSRENGAAVAADIKAGGGEALFVQTDVTVADDIAALCLETTAAFGSADVLVNNAGVNVFYEPLQMPDGEWERCMALDLKACWDLCRAVLPEMLARQRGSIVNIASTHAFRIIPHTFPYPVAKHALLGLTRALGVEYAPRGVRVNAIAPGYVDTPLVAAHFARHADPAAERKRIEALHPVNRIADPREIAWAAVFLASDEAPSLTAETIVIDGGRSALYHD